MNKAKIGKITYNVPLKNLTSYKLDGMALALIEPGTIEEVKNCLSYMKENGYKYKIIGGGSNLIFDGNYDGYLIKLNKLDYLKVDNGEVVVGAGYSTQKLSMKMCKLGLTGLEFATGIPGTIGGACVNNAGAYNSDMGYIIKEVKVLTPTLEIKVMPNKELDCHYRTSFFKKNQGYVILEVVLTLHKGNKEEILDIVEDRRKRRIEGQPLEYPSAGSVFRNPIGGYAGKLIEDIGYKGKQIGGAMVSTKHANFIINTGNAKGKDIVALIEEIKTKVKEQYNIELILEQEIVK